MTGLSTLWSQKLIDTADALAAAAVLLLCTSCAPVLLLHECGLSVGYLFGTSRKTCKAEVCVRLRWVIMQKADDFHRSRSLFVSPLLHCGDSSIPPACQFYSACLPVHSWTRSSYTAVRSHRMHPSQRKLGAFRNPN